MSKPITPSAMILAAGRGKRLGEFGKTTPKALVEIGGVPMIEMVAKKLATAGIENVVINLFHLGEKIEDLLGDGTRLGLKINYSKEDELLDVGGGIANAIPLLGKEPFIVTNCDIISEFDYSDAIRAASCLGDRLACLFLGANPKHQPGGDFSLVEGRVEKCSKNCLTYIGTAAYKPEIFECVQQGMPFPMMPIWQRAIDNGMVCGKKFAGKWHDLGTMERIESAKREFGH